jgi:hypothetical protein
LPGANAAAFLANARIGRHKGRVESAFCEDGSKVIRQTKGDKEGIGHGARAQHCRQDDVADKAADTRQQRKSADRQNAFNHQGLSLLPGRNKAINRLESHVVIAIARYLELP